MFNRPNLLRLSILLLALIIGLIIISARGCPKRSRDKIRSSGYEWAGIAAPSSLIATAFSYSEIRLTWQDNSDNEDGFEIERKIWAGGIWEQIVTVGVDITYYYDTGVFPSTTYYYRIRAFNIIGDRSDYSNESNATILDLTWSAIAAGYVYTVALTNDGTLWSWGFNENGQLGLGDTTPRLFPNPLGTETDWNKIACGGYHTLALKTNGTIWSWGANAYGQLGTGDTLYENWEPFSIGTDSDWQDIAGESGSSFASKSNGTLWAWGGNDTGQLGLGDYIDRTTPGQIVSDTDWSAFAAGNYHIIVLKNDKTIWTWGLNGYGQLGFGDSALWNVPTPTQIGLDSDWSIVATSAKSNTATGHTFAIKTNGTIWAWGYNFFGQLGLGDTINRWTPTQIKIGTDSDWSSVTGGFRHTIALKTNGLLWSWGDNYFGQLGFGDYINKKTPSQMGTESDWFPVVVAGDGYNLVLKSDRTIRIWGYNGYGQLGLGDTINRNIPCRFGSPTPPLNLIATTFSSSQINLSWIELAYNEEGFKIERKNGIEGIWEQIGITETNATSYLDTGLTFGTTYYYRLRSYNVFDNSPYSNEASATPTVIAPSKLTLNVISDYEIDLSWTDNAIDESGFKIERKIDDNGNWEEIGTVGPNITYYPDITETGFAPSTVYYYRVRGYNALGNGPYSTEVWTAISGNWSIIAVGGMLSFSNNTLGHTLARKIDGTIWAWGYNLFGQLGLGDYTNRNTPSQIGTLNDWFTLVAGSNYSIALKINSTIWSWGNNANGQLGLGDTVNRNTPSQIIIGTDSDWSTVATGYSHAVAIKKNATIWGWGNNNYGQLGLSDTSERRTPTQIIDSDWSKVSAGNSYTIALKTNGSIWAWGTNTSGQLGLGDGAPNSVAIPTQIGLDSDWSLIAAGISHAIAIKSNGTIWLWGLNMTGQLGLGDTNNRNTPSQITFGSGWLTAAGGLNYTIACQSNRSLWTWGDNTDGQLGLGDYTLRTTPTQIALDLNWSALAASYLHALARKTNGTIWAWGGNDTGQLGLGDMTSRNVLTLVGE